MDLNVTILPIEAFYRSALQTIILPKKLVIISDRAFAQSSITSISIPETVTEIGHSAFMECIYNHRTTKTNQKYPSVNL